MSLLYVYVARLGMLIGVAMLNLGLVLWLFYKKGGEEPPQMPIDIIRSSLALLALSLLLHYW